MNPAFILIATIFSTLGFCCGLLLILRPQKAIGLQQSFYARINWKIEPISMGKEIRNTRIMGFILSPICLLTLLLIARQLF